MIAFYSGDVNGENVSAFIKEVEQHYLSFPEDNILRIYFESIGGQVSCADDMIDYLNGLKKEITFVCSNVLFSSGFSIVFLTNAKRVFNKMSFGMIHQMDNVLSNVELSDKDSLDTLQKKIIDSENKKRVRFYKKIGVTTEEIKRYNKGYDVFFDAKRLRQFDDALRTA